MNNLNLSTRLRSNNFDLIRLLAAMQVAVSHANGHLESELSIPLLSYFPGVPIFFLVSGFLICLSYPFFVKYLLNKNSDCIIFNSFNLEDTWLKFSPDCISRFIKV